MFYKELYDSNPFYQIFKNPNVYLKNLITKTFLIGGLTLFIYIGVNSLELNSFSFPSTMHSLIGFIIGLLLVFRINTAYERWWDGRKIISSLETEVSLLNARINSLDKDSKNIYESMNLESVKKSFSDLLTILCGYLISKRSSRQTNAFNVYQSKTMEKVMSDMKGFDKSDMRVNGIYSSINNIVGYSTQLSRIKNTPIPIAFIYHIKTSLMIYMVTLPFGVFHDLGAWSVPLVMLLYFIIAGVEIISSEVENPFAGDPNDLPTERLFESMLKILNDE